jgi:peptide/nickel transport system substrate-binding protein
VYSLRRVLTDSGLDARYYLVGVEDVVARGPWIVEIHTRRPLAALLNRLAFVPILPRGRGSDVRDRADGTGPFRVEAWHPRESLSLRRHEGYWGPRPRLARAEFHLGREPWDVVEGLRAGRYQMAVLSEALVRVQSRSSRYRSSRESLHVQYRVRPLTGRPARRYRTPNLSGPQGERAINWRSIARVCLRAARVTSGSSCRPRSSASTRRSSRRPDLRKLVGCSGRLSLTGSRSPCTRCSCTNARGSRLETLGLHVTLEIPPEARYLELLKARRLRLWLDNWGCTTGESGELFENAMHTPDPANDLGAYNESGLRNPEIDALIESSRETTSIPLRRRALQNLMQRVLDEAPWVPLLADRDYYAVAEPYRYRPHAGRNLDLASVELSSGRLP